MASLVTQVIGVLGLVLGIAWVIWPFRMIELQYRILYFWTETPDVEDVANESVARISGLLLAAFGAALLVGVLP